MPSVECFTSAPIKLAARISAARRTGAGAQLAHLLLAGLLLAGARPGAGQASHLRQQAHYLNIVPSTHFRYHEGRQYSSGGAPLLIQARSAEVAPADEPQAEPAPLQHIYKRSSALVSSPLNSGSLYLPLVSSMLQPLGAGLRRRMMAAESAARWPAPAAPPADLSSAASEPVSARAWRDEPEEARPGAAARGVAAGGDQWPAPVRADNEDELLLRQKQHIQYHDQWLPAGGPQPSCHKRTLNFCASVLPFNTTTFPNIIGDTNRFEVKRSLPFFGFLAKSSCNRRLDELLCLLLEPPCDSQTGKALPPCKKFCRLALEGCNEYIPATLAMSSVFDCRQYPDSSEPGVCVNLAQGRRCASDEFQCPDKTCIPRNWLCDGVRDCLFAADEANCTAPTGAGPQVSVCSTEEFKCDGKCVPKAWKCDGERDCLDGTDEESCSARPKCGQDRFRCADGNGCIPKRWVCDGKAECRDGSDEMYCEQLECSENDFKCDNGICIPKLWRCDRQADCKDGSDERACVYAPLELPANASAPLTEEQLQANQVLVEAPASQPLAAYSMAGEQRPPEAEVARQPESAPPVLIVEREPGAGAEHRHQQQVAAEMKKFDYDLIKSSGALGGEPVATPAARPPQQQQQQQQQQQPEAQPVSGESAGARAVTQTSGAPTLDESGLPELQRRPQPPAGAGAVPARPELAARMPIYRSLFKSLSKGGATRAAGSGHKLAGVRRRRDRSPQQVRAALGVEQLQPPHRQPPGEPFHQQQLARAFPSATPSGEPATTGAPAAQLAPARNETAARSQSGAVASYFQLLNSRYNLRALKRSAGSPPVSWPAPVSAPAPLLTPVSAAAAAAAPPPTH